MRVLNAIEDFTGIPRYFDDQTYKPVKVNSTYQRNNRLLLWVLSRESVISTIDFIFPRSFIKRIRLAFDKLTMPKKDLTEKKIQLTEEERAFAFEVMQSDKEFVDGLLRKHSIFTGDLLASMIDDSARTQ